MNRIYKIKYQKVNALTAISRCCVGVLTAATFRISALSLRAVEMSMESSSEYLCCCYSRFIAQSDRVPPWQHPIIRLTSATACKHTHCSTPALRDNIKSDHMPTWQHPIRSLAYVATSNQRADPHSNIQSGSCSFGQTACLRSNLDVISLVRLPAPPFAPGAAPRPLRFPLEFRVQGPEFRVLGLEFRVHGRVLGL